MFDFTHTILREHLTRVASGDKAAFSELYDLTRTAVYGLALSCMKLAQDARDITQDTFVRVWESAGQYRPTGSAKSWIPRNKNTKRTLYPDLAYVLAAAPKKHNLIRSLVRYHNISA